MSRRHHGNRPHRPSGQARPADPARTGLETPAPPRVAEPRPDRADVADARPFADRGLGPDGAAVLNVPAVAVDRAPLVPLVDGLAVPALDGRDGHPESRPLNGYPPGQPGLAGGPNGGNGYGPSCTAPQLRRFIKSRPYVPMHELRRRFGIAGDDDDMSSIDLRDRRVYVGLPPREGSLLGELLRGGDIGYELSLDPRTPVVIGLYPMRPVART